MFTVGHNIYGGASALCGTTLEVADCGAEVRFLHFLPRCESPKKSHRGGDILPPFKKLLTGIKSLIVNGNFMLLTIVFVLLQIVSNIVNCNLAALLYPYYYPAVSCVYITNHFPRQQAHCLDSL